ncbi:PadR family transcriptional regulator [Marinoscillum pacificum]|uniref:PadR family transcriptional regulator n=1 Tax=Marinoscillum pacificum TaxID=392723 RepID=UPI0021585542|nr:helix-turn-helix transcriptional regulator [Marinoscillum pacificum]
MSKDHLGELEELILLVILKLEEQAYGLAIQKEIQSETSRNVTIGAVHGTVNRLESKGLLESAFGGATEERGGRRKRFLKITSAGMDALRQSKELRLGLWNQIPSLAITKDDTL